MSKLLCSTKFNKILNQTLRIIPTTTTTATTSSTTTIAASSSLTKLQRRNLVITTSPVSTFRQLSQRAVTVHNFQLFCKTSTVQFAVKKPYSCLTSSSSSSINNSLLPLHFRVCSFHKYTPVMDAPEHVFRGCVDRFSGITVDSKAEFQANMDFAAKLQTSLDYWIKNNRRAIWFKVYTEQADWIPHLAKQDFDFHHARNGYVVMYRWLPLEEYPNLPDYAHTMVGVGGVVINEQNEVLVVSEKHAIIPDSWKLPGGYVEPRENIIDAAIREVREETGIDCQFRTIVSMRHSHGGSFGCSDVYVVVALKPLNSNLQRCEREIERIQWMPVAEYLQHPHVHETNRHFVRTFLEYDSRNLEITCKKAQHQILKKDYCLYYVKEQTKDDEAQNTKAKI